MQDYTTHMILYRCWCDKLMSTGDFGLLDFRPLKENHTNPVENVQIQYLDENFTASSMSFKNSTYPH